MLRVSSDAYDVAFCLGRDLLLLPCLGHLVDKDRLKSAVLQIEADLFFLGRVKEHANNIIRRLVVECTLAVHQRVLTSFKREVPLPDA